WGDRAKQLKIRQETDDFLAVRLKSTDGRHLHNLSALFSNIDALGLKHNDGDFCPALLVIGILWDLDPQWRRLPDSATTDRGRKYGVSRSNIGSSSNAAADEPLLWQGRPVLCCPFGAKKENEKQRRARFLDGRSLPDRSGGISLSDDGHKVYRCANISMRRG